MKKTRPLGQVLLDLEHLLDEMYLHHDLQIGDVMALVYGNSIIHYPESQEVYQDGSNPIYFYGSLENKPKKS